MAAFLSKVFPRKKEKDTNKRASASSLLEGKFEAVSPTVSPSAAKFEEAAQKPKERGREKEKEKEKEKDSGFSLFRPKSRPLSPPPDARKTASDAPHLTLNLPVPKEERSRALGVVFEGDPDDIAVLPDNVIGERRLNPLEALLLVKACSSAIVANGGLETLGVMHPFWYSASPEVQRKLISLFILSLAPKSPITTLSPSPTSALSTFDTELEYTRSPHDIAAVLRWALRHLRLEGDSFGRTDEQWKWYQAFAEAERSSSFPLNAFSDALVPQLPPSHLQLLTATLDIVSSLAAHSEHNGISGSKLSKFFGLWLLTTKRTEQDDDWSSFYSRWERAGRILEHLFLAHIRDEMSRKKMPLRLAELVKGYPYHSRSPSADTTVSVDIDLLPRPRLSTRQYDALYVRIETQLPDAKSTKQKQHPLRLIADALKSELQLTDSQFANMWEAVRKSALANDEPEPILTHVDGYPSVSRIFSDETIRLLSLIPAESTSSKTYTVPTIRLPRPPRKTEGAASAQANGNGKATTNGSATVRGRSATTTTTPGSPKDWSDFSTSGFGDSALGKDFASTLLDKDVEVTNPRPVVERKTSKKRKASPGRRSSVDNPNPDSANLAAQLSPPQPLKSKSTIVKLVKLDEAFIDFWSDALLDPISSDWPNFVVAQLKSLPGVEVDGKPISWLVLEQRFVAPIPPPPPPPAESEATSPGGAKRASSPRPSMRSEFSGRKSSTLAAAKKRFTFFSSSQTLGGLSSKAEAKATARKKSKPTRVGEMGEILPEDDKAEGKAEKKQHETEIQQKAAGAVPKDAAVAPAAEAPKAAESAAEESKGAAPATSAPAEVPVATPTDAMSPLTPTADDFPAVPVVGGLVAAATADATPAAVEPLKTDDAPTEDKPVLAVAEEPTVPADATPTTPAEGTPQERTLPPAPEPVVLTGETPGPQVALSTSEPAALAELSTKIDEVVAQAASSPEVDQLLAEESDVSPDAHAGQQTTEIIPAVPVMEEVIPFATSAEAAAAVQEVAEKEAQDESPVTDAAVAEAEVPSVAVAEPAAPEPEPEAVAPEEPAVPEEPPATAEEPAPVPEEPVVDEPVAAAEAPAEEPIAEVPAQAEPAAVLEEPVVEAAEATAVAEPEEPAAAPEEASAVPAEETTAAAAEEAIAEPAETVAAEPQPEVPVPTELEGLAVSEPEAAAEPAHEEEAAAPAAPEETVQEEEAGKEGEIPAHAPAVEEVKDAEHTVVEDVAAPNAEEVVVEPTPEQPAAEPAVEELAAVEPAVEEPAAEEPAAEEPAAEVKDAAAPEVAEEAAAEPEAAIDNAPEESSAAAAPEVQETPATEPEAAAAAAEPEAEEVAEAAEETNAESAPAAEEAAQAETEAEPAPTEETAPAPATEDSESAEKHENGTVHTEVAKAEDAPAPETVAETETTGSEDKPAAPAASSD
ncbi:hypothetical protein OH77DRAFT_1430335 [Trametes cingulata]|nr:hypothetical protein OH77DRAFT_1430335 [Trametes cingulata]